MYAHSTTAFSRASVSAAASPLPPFPDLGELDSVQETLSQLNNSEHGISYSNNNNSSYKNNNNSYYSCSSGYSSYGGSPTSVASPTLMQRSVSSHSLLHKNETHHHQNHPLSAFFAELLDSDDGPVRRVYSTGDLQRINGMQNNNHSESPLLSESSMIIEGMSRACRYSPEEKKLRIERYRNKRNQRNFTKKIKYACRKTLADSRPRIRGRFARNDEIDKNNPAIQWSHIGDGEEEDDEDENWISMFDSLVAASFAEESQSSSSFGPLY